MIIHKNDNLIEAVTRSDQPKIKIAVNADSSINTLEKMLAGETDMQLSSMEKIAGYLGFNVEVRYVPQPKASGATA